MTETFDARIDLINKQYQAHQRAFLAVVIIGFIVNGLLFWYASGPERPGRALMRFTYAAPVRQAELCPGDTLNYDLSLEVTGPGVFAVIVSVWRVDPPAVVVWEESPRHVAFDRQQAYSVARSWVVPLTHTDPVTGEPVAWLPGQYERHHAIVTVSRSTEPSIVVVPFSIRPDCGED